MLQRCIKLLIYELRNYRFEFFYCRNNNTINENGVLIHFTLKTTNENFFVQNVEN